MRIGELSLKTGVSQRMLRYYEQEGLIAPKRSHQGYRFYDDRSVALVCHIRNLNDAGIKLNIIKELLPCISGEENKPKFVGCPNVKAALQKELEDLDVKLKELNNSRNAVAGYLLDLLPEHDERS